MQQSLEGCHLHRGEPPKFGDYDMRVSSPPHIIEAKFWRVPSVQNAITCYARTGCDGTCTSPPFTIYSSTRYSLTMGALHLTALYLTVLHLTALHLTALHLTALHLTALPFYSCAPYSLTTYSSTPYSLKLEFIP